MMKGDRFLPVGIRPVRLPNPPGQAEIAFRLADQTGFFDWLFQLLRRSGPAPPLDESTDVSPQYRQRTIQNALNRLNPDDPRGFITALLKSWASVGDVLTFYQERIANEGYLRTAIDPVSVHELARAIGYRPRPGLSATTFLAFDLLDARPRLDKLIVPAGSAVQSVPLPGQTPVVFETDEEIEARPIWNRMAPAVPATARMQRILEGATWVRVRGSAPGVRLGTPVLLCGTPAAEGGSTSYLRWLSAVERDAKTESTLLCWQEPLPGTAGRLLFDSAKVFIFRQAARLFGATIPDWQKLPNPIKAKFGVRQGDIAFAPFFAAANACLPAGNVSALAIGADNAVYAAIGDTLLRHDGDARWQTMGMTPNRSAITALTVAVDGRLYAGTQRGEVLASADQGASWFGIQGPFGMKSRKHESARLPSVAVSALAAIPSAHGATMLLAGTPIGLWQTEANGGNWRGWNEGLPGYKATSGAAGVEVTGILEDPAHHKRFILTTKQGLFHAGGPASRWRPATIDLGVAAEVRSMLDGAEKGGRAALATIRGVLRGDGRQTPAIHAIAALPSWRHGSRIFAGHDYGVLRSVDGGRLWRPTGPILGPANVAVTSLAADGNRVLAGTAAGLFVSTDDGEHWAALPGLFSKQAVAALAAGGGQAIAAAHFTGFAEPDRSEFSIALNGSEARIHLDRVYPAAVAGSWAVFVPEEAPATATVHRVLSASIVSQTVNHASRRVSRLVVAAPGPIVAKGTVYLSSAALDLIEDANPGAAVLTGGGPIALAGAIKDLAGRHVAITGRHASVFICGPAGGIRQWDPDRQGWTLIEDGYHDGRALLVTRPGHAGEAPKLLMGSEADVKCLRNGEWVRLGNLGQTVNALIQAVDGAIVVGTDRGVWHRPDADESSDHGWLSLGLAQTRVSAIAFSAPNGRLWAGTASGLFYRPGVGLTDSLVWTAERTSAGAQITALVSTGQGLAAAAADGRIFREAEGDWQTAIGPPAARLNALAVDTKERIYAATNSGLFFSTDNAVSWARHPAAKASDDARALAIDPMGVIWLAIHGRGVTKDGRPLRTGVANEFRSFAFLEGSVFAGSLSATTLLPVDPFAAGEATEPVFVAQFQDVAIAAELMDGPASPALRRLLSRHRINLSKSALVRWLSDTQSWSIGEPGNAISMMLRASRPAKENGDEPLTWYVFRTVDLEVIRRPEPVAGDKEFALWHLRTANGALVTLIAGRDELVYRPSHVDCQPDAEICRIVGADIAADRSVTILLLDPPLANVYDIATVTFNANVAAASHGESSVLYEAVGSADASRRYQKFKLQRSPLTALATATEPFYRFAVSLRVRPSHPKEPLAVNGQLRPRDLESEAVEWHQVPTLSQSGPEDQHFAVEFDDNNSATLSFGDGHRGKRLPTGIENVIARYRVGAGPQGNVDANRLTLLTKRPPGVRRVTNPLPASSGTAPDSPDDIRENAPLTIRNLGRLVTQRDYEDFVRAWPGIAKVAVRRLHVPHALLHITIADDETVPVDLESSVFTETSWNGLSQAIQANCAIPHSLRIDRCKVDWFNLTAEIVIANGHDPEAVLGELRAMLRDCYSFSRQELIQPVRESALIARMQASPGVEAVYMRELYLLGRKPELCRELHAMPAHLLPSGEIAPAELLLINPRQADAGGLDGILLMQVAS